MHKTTYPCGGTHPPQLPILQPRHHDHRHRCTAAISPPFIVTSAVTSAASSWLRNRRIRYFCFLLCSPILLVLLCVAFPFLCAAELCLRRRVRRKVPRDSGGDGSGDRLRRCEEGCCGGCGGDGEVEEKGLLHRYLEDQLLLVGSMYDCGDIEEEEEYSRRVEDDENLGSNRIPLLR